MIHRFEHPYLYGVLACFMLTIPAAIWLTPYVACLLLATAGLLENRRCSALKQHYERDRDEAWMRSSPCKSNETIANDPRRPPPR
jgi:hypothetical protein